MQALLPRLSTFPGPRSQRGKRPASSGMQRTMASTFFGRQRPCSPQFQAYEESVSALTGERASEAELHTLPPTLLQAGHGNWASPTRTDRHQQLLSTLHGLRQGQVSRCRVRRDMQVKQVRLIWMVGPCTSPGAGRSFGDRWGGRRQWRAAGGAARLCVGHPVGPRRAPTAAAAGRWWHLRGTAGPRSQ